MISIQLVQRGSVTASIDQVGAADKREGMAMKKDLLILLALAANGQLVILWFILLRILNRERRIIRQEKSNMINLQDILTKATAQKGVIDSITVLLTSVSAELRTAIANNDPTAMQAIADQLDANTAEAAAAVVANPDPAQSDAAAAGPAAAAAVATPAADLPASPVTA